MENLKMLFSLKIKVDKVLKVLLLKIRKKASKKNKLYKI